MAIIEKIIARTTGLPLEGDNWFKKNPLTSIWVYNFSNLNIQVLIGKKVFPILASKMDSLVYSSFSKSILHVKVGIPSYFFIRYNYSFIFPRTRNWIFLSISRKVYRRCLTGSKKFVETLIIGFITMPLLSYWLKMN